eukprot:2565841-Prymnesium_polylepis.1
MARLLWLARCGVQCPVTRSERARNAYTCPCTRGVLTCRRANPKRPQSATTRPSRKCGTDYTAVLSYS